MAGFVWDQFKETEPISTYLVAFAVTDINYIARERFRIWAHRDSIESADYALSVAPEILQIFEEYLDVRYDLPKIDLITIPDYFVGAMESWGLIMFRESALLYDSKNYERKRKERVFNVIAHELAHQWLGNLVSFSWWTDLWVMESFASFLPLFASEKMQPEWKTCERFIHYATHTALVHDASVFSKPIISSSQTPDAIVNQFSVIAYQKGASIVRMLYHILTPDIFRVGLNKFLVEKYEYRH